MSSTTTSFRFFTRSTTPSAPTSTSTPSSGGSSFSSSPSSFYKNLFYILIGLLIAFALVSFASLLRARRRRHAIVREAERLGVVVPGIPGYVPMRDRLNMLWTKADGSQDPDWWEVNRLNKFADEKVVGGDGGDGNGDAGGSGAGGGVGVGVSGNGDGAGDRWVDGSSFADEQFQPLAVIPPPPTVAPTEPIPISPLPYFPNHLAYRPQSMQPLPTRFDDLSDLSRLHQLEGETVEVITIVRMPAPPMTRRPPHPGDDDEGQEIMMEWSGVEIGIAEMEVVGRRLG
ncbi:hypothetical protein CI109_101123 [Kwoniella shandongensis]|uniref:Uncharacterized protein n=1 Tax=Kwoniella shandongensis TaxID=1734106 RepID=A0A5M6C4U1_9TREE|nr:uncharacterized protein CI109_001593 [Kwoniella shandongensis]KAA5530187.1 hypothetical protein CI109_001593 [Kwoniella shandongensis]